MEERSPGGDAKEMAIHAIAAKKKNLFAGVVSADLRYALNVLPKTNGVSVMALPGSALIAKGSI